jgi:septum site-determining protein MinD
MSKIITVHSYKGGTGKTIISVNLAATFVKQGKKVALFDLDFRAPSLFAILKCEKATTWLNDYLNGTCDINNVLIDLSARIPNAGKLYVGLANPSTDAMQDMSQKDRRWEMRALRRLLSLRRTLFDEQKFDYIIFDTSPGLQYASMNAIVAADFVVVTTTGDCSDVNGTKRMIADFYKMFEKKTGIVLNKTFREIKNENDELYSYVKETYNVPLLGVVSCCCDIVKAEGKYIFPQDKPQHAFTNILAEMAAKIEQNQIDP